MTDGQMTVLVDGVSLAVRRFGHGAPVVCLHAIGHDSRDFEPLRARIGDRFELIAVDWPGHGGSGPDHEATSAGRYGRLLTGLLDTLDLGAPIVIGNSIGGAAAILSARARPVTGLVLCDSGGLVAVTPLVGRFCRLFEGFFAAGERGAWWYGAAYSLYYRLVLPMPAARDRRREIVGQGRALARLLREAWASFGRPDADIRAVAAGLDIPIWSAWGARDRVIPLAACRAAIAALKHGSLTSFDAGHSAFLEQPDLFAQGFLAWAHGLTTADGRPAASARP